MARFLFVVRFKTRENGRLSNPKDCKIVARDCGTAASKCKKARGGKILYVRKLKELHN
jgi:hypothetical protein